MKSFKSVLMNSIKRNVFSKEYYEQTIANWLLHNWLNDEEATEAISALEDKSSSVKAN